MIFKLIIVAVIAAGISVSVSTGNWYLPSAVIIAGAALILVLKRNVKGISEDERDRKMAGRASLMAMSIYSVASAIVGTTLVALGKGDPLMYTVGSTALYSACSLVVLYAVLFKIYARKQDRD